MHYIKSGWPATQCAPAMQPYWNRRHELTSEQGGILWGIHVIVLHSLQDQVVRELHQSHPPLSV